MLIKGADLLPCLIPPPGEDSQERGDNSLPCPPIVPLSRPRSQPVPVYLCLQGDTGEVFIHSLNSLRCCVLLYSLWGIEPCVSPLLAASKHLSKHTCQCIIQNWDFYPVKFTCLETVVGSVECYVGIFVPKPREIYTEIICQRFSVEFATVRIYNRSCAAIILSFLSLWNTVIPWMDLKDFLRRHSQCQ